MKIISVFLLTLLFPVLASAEADFRGFSWGATEDEVRSRESATSVDLDADNTTNTLVYQTDISGYRFKLTYLFDGSKKMLMATYSIKLERLDISSFKSMKKFFINFDKLLSEKYGNHSLPSKEVDPALMSNNTTFFSVNEDIEYFLTPDNSDSTRLSEMLNDEKIQKIINENRCRFSLKWETEKSVVVLEVQNSDETVYYFEKNTYKSFNDRQRKILEESKRKDLGGL